MDVTLTAQAGLTVRILERPGRWMTAGQLAELQNRLRDVAAQTLVAGALDYGVFADDPAVMDDIIVTLVSHPDGRPLAFNALAVMQVDTGPRPTEVLHLGLVMVDPAERSRNLSWVLYGLTCFLIFVRRQFRPVWVSSVSQVPRVVGMVCQMFSGVWPGPAAERRSLQQLLLARAILARHRDVFGVGPEADFDETRFVISNAYTGGSDDLKKTWKDAPKHRDDAYNAFCANALDYVRGDDVLQLGQMDMAAMRRYLAREVPKSAVFGLLVAGAVVALQRIVLPVLHWSDSGADWSILRARKGRRG